MDWIDYTAISAAVFYWAWQWDRLRPPFDALGRAVARYQLNRMRQEK